jgi:serine/threonine-protein kinase HipA
MLERVRQLDVSIAGQPPAGQLLKTSTYEFRYLKATAEQPCVALGMPAAARLTWSNGDLFPPMDQNLPEGELYMRIRELYPKQALTPMHLLALLGDNGIGRLGFRVPEQSLPPAPPPISKQSLLATTYSPRVFDELVAAYLSTGAGISGMQPKIMVPVSAPAEPGHEPSRFAAPIPTLIVKAASSAYPDLAANEYLCLRAAQLAGIETPVFDLSHDGRLLVLERFDAVASADGTLERLGFEDIAALTGQRVRDTLSDRKYHGSYERIVGLLRQLQLPQRDLDRFFEQLAFSVMVRNGDAHLKNFGLLYRSSEDIWLSPMFDVVTTVIYRYARSPGGPELVDNTLALKLFAGKGASKVFPTTAELLRFGSKVCGTKGAAAVLERIASGMQQALTHAATDDRIPPALLARMREAWESGFELAREAQGLESP